MSEESRKKLANLSFSEKIKLLEQLRERSLAFAAARKRRAEKKKAKNSQYIFLACLFDRSPEQKRPASRRA